MTEISPYMHTICHTNLDPRFLIFVWEASYPWEASCKAGYAETGGTCAEIVKCDDTELNDCDTNAACNLDGPGRHSCCSQLLLKRFVRSRARCFENSKIFEIFSQKSDKSIHCNRLCLLLYVSINKRRRANKPKNETGSLSVHFFTTRAELVSDYNFR